MKSLALLLLAFLSASIYCVSAKGQDSQSDHRELTRLLQEVECSLVAIDQDLVSAGAGEMNLTPQAPTRLADLLRSSLRDPGRP